MHGNPCMVAYSASPPLSQDGQASPVPDRGTGGFTLVLRRLLALGLVGAALYAGHTFPVASTALVAGLAAYALLLAWVPSAWLVVIPTLIPVLDLMPWSGRLYLNELDFFLLVTVASALWHRQRWFRPLGLNRAAVLVLALLIGWQTVATLRGFLPLQELDATALAAYYSHWNSLRLAKGFLWALLLLPLLGQARARGDALSRWLTAGMVAGLTAAILSIAWERALFTGLFNFDAPYRATGLFAGMHTGGAAVDGFLAVTLPFLAGLLLLWRAGPAHLVGLALFAPALYALFVSFSRANYLALAALALAFALGALVLRTSRRPAETRSARPLTLTLLALGALVLVPVLAGTYLQARFATTAEDLKGRFAHWPRILALMEPDSTTQLLGMGKGAFPRAYYWAAPGDTLPATLALVAEDGDPFVRFSASAEGNLFLRQRFRVDEPGPYRLTLKLRPRTAAGARLLVEVCERNILPWKPECDWMGFDTGTDPGEWIDFHRPFSVQGLGERHWYGARPVDVSILNRGLTDGIDIDEVQVITPSGARLLANGDFSQGLDHWYPYFGDHLAWHMKNLWVDAYFEGGWLGLAALLLLQAYLLVRLVRRLRAGDRLALVLLAAFAAFFAVGVFDSPFDEPRLTWLFFLLASVTMLPSEPQPRGESAAGPPGPLARLWDTTASAYRRLPTVARAGVTAAGVTALVLAAFGYLQHHSGMTGRQVLLRLAEKSTGERSWLVDALSAPPADSAALSAPPLRSSRPRILLPELATWDGRGQPPAMAEREAAYRARGLTAPSACERGGIAGHAACWVTTGDPAAAARLRDALVSTHLERPTPAGIGEGNGWEIALGYDLLRTDPALSSEDRALIEAKLVSALRHALLLLDDEGPALWHGRASLAAQTWLWAAALDAADPSTAALVARARGHFEDTLRALALSEAWPEGYAYWVNSRAFLLALAASAYLNGLQDDRQAEEVRRLLARVGYWAVYATRPDHRIEGLGDEGPRVDLKDETRRVIDLLAQATRSPVLASYSDWLGRLHGAESYYRDYRWGFRLFNDPRLPRAPGVGAGEIAGLEGVLPTAALFGRDALNLAYLRSGWGPDDTFISFRGGATLSHHGHYDAGHFTLFKGAPLAVNSSVYGGDVFAPNRRDYSIRTVAKNSLLILRPGEKVRPNESFRDNVADGGQRVTMPTGSTLTSAGEWIRNLDEGLHLAGGEITAFDHVEGQHTYLAADLTRAYNTPDHDQGGSGGKVQRVTRQLLYLRAEDRLVIRDEVIATDPSYTKKWLLHTVHRPVVANLRVRKGSADNGILEAPAAPLQVTNGRGHLRVDPLLPADGVVRLVGGPDYRFYVEADGDDRDLDGRNMAEGAVDRPWFDPAQWRIELQPGAPRLRDEFLVVLSPSLERPADGTVDRVRVSSGEAVGLVTPQSVVLFVRQDSHGPVTAQWPAGAEHLFVAGLPPRARVTLDRADTTQTLTASEHGNVHLRTDPSSGGPLTLNWEQGR